MPTPPNSPPPIAAPPSSSGSNSGSEWFGARTKLAARRSARFAKVWGLTFGALTLFALLIPVMSGDPTAPRRAANGQLAADTLRSAQRLREALGAVAAAESSLVVARSDSVAPRRDVPDGIPALVAPEMMRPVTSAVTELGARIARARRERSVVAWLAVAEHPAVNGPRMRALADSLRAYDGRRAALATAGTGAMAEITQRIDRAGNTIVAIADNRRRELEASGVAAVPVPRAPVASTTAAAPERPAARAERASGPDTTTLRAALEGARQSLVRAQQAHDSLTTALSLLEATNSDRDSGPSLLSVSPAIALASLLVLGMLVRFATALRGEMRRPTLADSREAVRCARVPVLATVRAPMLEGPARFHPSGIDPFRMLYLGLTATGTRVRTAIVTGADPVVVAATGARLAIAAAADHRQTLVVDLDPANIPLSRTFRERAEPGTTDVLARAFAWREVARPVGSSDGLLITLLPAGTERQDLATGSALEELMEGFARLRASYELTIVVAPPEQVAFALTLIEASPVILTAIVGETRLADLVQEAEQLLSAHHRVQGLVLWDAPQPELLSRAELAALLSKRKGRTPGGSFEAVQRAISPHLRDITKPS